MHVDYGFYGQPNSFAPSIPGFLLPDGQYFFIKQRRVVK
jgi:hypothetical protein